MRTYNPVKDCYWLGMKVKLYAKTYEAIRTKRQKRANWLAFLAERETMNNHYLRVI
jgi:hypothetical protein